jgi:predicted RND superfamily exporter protein
MALSSRHGLGVTADWLIRHRAAVLIATVALAALSIFPASKLELEQTIESLYSPDDPHLAAYLESRAAFGGDEFIIVAYTDPHLLEPEGIARTREFADRLGELPGINPQSTQSLAKALDFSHIPFFLRPLFNERMRKQMLEFARGLLIGSDNRTTAIVLRLLPREQTPLGKNESFEEARTRTFRDVRELAAAHDPPAAVVGEPVQLHDMFRYVQEDGTVLFWWSLVLLSLVQFAFFRNVRFVAMGILVVVVTIVWTEAIVVLLGMRLSMVSSMLNSLVTIVGIATATHALMFYRGQRAHANREQAFRTTFIEMAPPVFWECVTTAAGFASLLSSDVGPVRSFGIILSIGCLLVIVALVGVLPGGMLIGRWQSDATAAPVERNLSGALRLVFRGVERWPGTILLVAAALSVLAAAGFPRLEVETDFSRNFRSNSPIVKALDFVETRLGGAGTWEVNFPAPDELDEAYLQKVRLLADELRAMKTSDQPALTKVVALTDVLDVIQTIPFLETTLENKLDVVRRTQPEFITSLYDPARKRMRLVLRALERQPAANKLNLISEVEQKARSTFGEAKATGLFVLLALIIESLLRDQLVSFAIAGASMFLIMVIAFRSLRIGLISLAPNVLPNLLLIGALGWLRIPINIGTAMIASVAIGLTVDASIHYLAGIRRLAASGMSFTQALRETQTEVGLALVFATLALVVGFSVLVLSHFIPLIYFGALVSLAMLGGLVGNLVLLPVLLRFGGPWWKQSEADVHAAQPAQHPDAATGAARRPPVTDEASPDAPRAAGG